MGAIVYNDTMDSLEQPPLSTCPIISIGQMPRDGLAQSEAACLFYLDAVVQARSSQIWSLHLQRQHPSGTMLETHNLGPHSNLLDQILWEWGPAFCFHKLPGDSDSC